MCMHLRDDRVSGDLDLEALHLVLEGADLRVEVRSFVALEKR
jgi:hypothetical protein